ncbi:MAG: hypothetical protein JXA43_00380 [Candidatus Diapherotrites archaeon]|nr:hypothetical protein [Candidatus Diapherotrites archaeon]
MNHNLADDMHKKGKTMHELAKEMDLLTTILKNNGNDVELPPFSENRDILLQMNNQLDSLRAQVSAIQPKKEFKSTNTISTELGKTIEWKNLVNENDFDPNL